jgi:diacylglycerol kinase family enzyme
MPLIVSGGDGTLFHLLQHLRPPFPDIAIVPAGRGNALARDLLSAPEPVAVDVLEAAVTPAAQIPFTAWCLSSVAFGYPVTVTRRSLALRRLHRLSYAAASVITRPRRQTFSLSLNGEPALTRSLTGILVNNTRHIGGFVAIPSASCSDGFADCMELSSLYLSQMAHHLSAISRADCYAPARVTRIQAAVITPPQPQELMLDGELIPAIARIDPRLSPAAIRCSVLRPRGCS